MNELFKFKYIDGKKILVSSKHKPTFKNISPNKLELLNIIINDDNLIKLGDKLPLKLTDKNKVEYSTYYIANKIYKNKPAEFQINEFDLNETSIFVTPLVLLTNDLANLDCFINSYIRHYKYENYIGDQLYFIYRYSPFDYYDKIVSYFKNHPRFVEYFKDQDKRFDVFTIEIPKQYTNDVKLLMKGKFSKISNNAKMKILSYHKLGINSPIYDVLYRTDKLKKEKEKELGVIIPDDIDLRSIPSLEKEIWNYSKIN